MYKRVCDCVTCKCYTWYTYLKHLIPQEIQNRKRTKAMYAPLGFAVTVVKPHLL